MTMTEKDLALIAELRRDSRQSLKSLWRKTGVRMSTIHDKLRDWRRDGIIRRFTVQVDYAALGKHAQAIIFLRVPRQQRQCLYDALASRPEVETFYRINNGWDYLAHIVAKDFLALEAFLEHLENEFGVQAKEAHYLLEEGVKRIKRRKAA